MLVFVSEPGNLVLDVIEQFGEQAVEAGCGEEEPSFIMIRALQGGHPSWCESHNKLFIWPRVPQTTKRDMRSI